MKLNVSKPASKNRVRLPIVLTAIPVAFLTIMIVISFPEFVDRMSRAIENTELNGALNETGTSSTWEIIVVMAMILVDVILLSYLIRTVKNYRRIHLHNDKRLIRERNYSRLFRTWLND
jgi:hypothetical protein